MTGFKPGSVVQFTVQPEGTGVDGKPHPPTVQTQVLVVAAEGDRVVLASLGLLGRHRFDEQKKGGGS